MKRFTTTAKTTRVSLTNTRNVGTFTTSPHPEDPPSYARRMLQRCEAGNHSTRNSGKYRGRVGLFKTATRKQGEEETPTPILGDEAQGASVKGKPNDRRYPGDIARRGAIVNPTLCTPKTPRVSRGIVSHTEGLINAHVQLPGAGGGC